MKMIKENRKNNNQKYLSYPSGKYFSRYYKKDLQMNGTQQKTEYISSKTLVPGGSPSHLKIRSHIIHFIFNWNYSLKKNIEVFEPTIF